MMESQFVNKRSHVSLRDAESALKNVLKFGENGFGQNQLVLGENQTIDVSREASGGEGADQNVGVERDLQETSRKTSSSVRKPRASANGMAISRCFSNAISASCRFSASRMISERETPSLLDSVSNLD